MGRRLTPRKLVLQVRTLRWGLRAVRQTRATLRDGDVRSLELPPPPLGDGLTGLRGVRLALLAARATCLPRSMIEQAFRSHRGDPRDVIIGVKGGTSDFAAHAWVDGLEAHSPEEFVEMTRLPAVVAVAAPADG